MKPSMSASEPVRVNALAVPPTVTLPLLVASSVPDATVNVACTLALPASRSAKEMPVTGEATSSVTVTDAGAEIVGASFSGVTLICAVLIVVSLPPSGSLTVKVTVRCKVEGVSLVSV